MKKMRSWILLSFIVLIVSGCGTFGPSNNNNLFFKNKPENYSPVGRPPINDELDRKNPDKDNKTTPEEKTPDTKEDGQEKLLPSEQPEYFKKNEKPTVIQQPTEIKPPADTKKLSTPLPNPTKKWEGYYSISTGNKEHLLIIEGTEKSVFKFTLQTDYSGANKHADFIEAIAIVKGNTATYKTDDRKCVLTFTDKSSAMVIQTNSCSKFVDDAKKGYTYAGTYKKLKQDPRWTGTYSFGNERRGSKIMLSDYNGKSVKAIVRSWQKDGVPSDYNIMLTDYLLIEAYPGPGARATTRYKPAACHFDIVIKGKEMLAESITCTNEKQRHLIESYPYLKET